MKIRENCHELLAHFHLLDTRQTTRYTLACHVITLTHSILTHERHDAEVLIFCSFSTVIDVF